MFSYDSRALSTELAKLIEAQLSSEAWQWLQEKVNQITNQKTGSALNTTFAAIPRKINKAPVLLDSESLKKINSIRPGLSLQNWSMDRLCRVWVLMQIPAEDKASYVAGIETLFLAAEMNELVALYSALPLLAYPEAWRNQCAEGIRSNIGDVLEAIMCENPYPAEQLDQAAWNQMVLKGIFTEKPLNRIQGLDSRANEELANTLSDFAHERWAAHRTVPPMLWRCVGPFINDKTFADIERIAQSLEYVEREAAALACGSSQFPPAKELLKNSKELSTLMSSGEASWEKIANKTEGV